MEKNRPQGRDKYVTENGKGVHKRGDGLNTGPVGGGTAFNDNSGGSGGKRSSGGGKSNLLTIIIAAAVLLGGGGGLSTLLGGSGDTGTASTQTVSTVQTTVTATPKPTAAPTATPKPAAQNTTAAAATEARAKRTVLKGNGQDTVTVMVYMCGTDLESSYTMGTKDMLEMTKAKWGDNMHVLVYTGGCRKWQNSVVSASVNQIYEIVDGGLKTLVADDGQKAMTDPATLSAFIQWCVKNYPADRNELILWDHGGGSVSGYGYDEKFSSRGSMTLDGVAQALRDAGTTFDFIGFDACLMATLETGLVLDDFADYLVASEETEPGIGWYYTNWLTALGSNTSIDTVSLGTKIVDDFVTTCASGAAGQSATLSVVDLAELSAAAPAALKSFSQSLSSMIESSQYQQISTARNGAREFAQSSKIDQIDLMDFANRLGTAEGQELIAALQGAVKYNRTSAGMSGSNGISIYFPYRKASTVDKAVSTYSAIGMDESYSQAIREFASLEVSGQAASGSYGTGSMTSLLEALMGGSSSAYGSGSGTSSSYSSYGNYGTTDMISGLLGALMGGGLSGGSSAGSGTMDFLFGRSLPQEDAVAYIADNFFDASALVWTENSDGQPVIALAEDQWDLIEAVDMNLFYDDGAGYIDLGLDNLYSWDDDGNLVADTDRTWLAVDGQPVAYYHESSDDDVIRGYIPAMLDGVRGELLVVFDEENPHGALTGFRNVYVDGETETVAKGASELTPGSTLEFLCDYYTYDGEYENTYYLGEPMTVTESMELSNVFVGDSVLTLYRFTDLYQQHYWTPALEA